MNTVVEKEKFLNMRINDEEKAAIDRTFQAMGMKQREGVSRLMRWFVTLDDETRYAILGPESMRPDLARLVLERMAASERGEESDMAGSDEEHRRLIEETDARVEAERAAQSNRRNKRKRLG